MRGLLAALLATVPAAAFAQAADNAAAPMANQQLMSFLPLVAILGVFYFILIKPQQRRMKEHQATLNALKKGDEVVTSGGIVGKITKINDTETTISVEIAKGVEVSVIKSTVSGLVHAPKVEVTSKKKAGNVKNDNVVPSRESVANDN